MHILAPPAALNELLTRYRDFLTTYVYPIELEVLSKPFRQSLPVLNSLREDAKKKKLFAPHLATEDGGLGLGLLDFAYVSELLGTSPLGHYIFNCQAPDIGNMELLHGYAGNALKEEFLHPLQQGKIRSCFAMTEPAFAGSNPVHLGTTAVREGDHYVINGHKWFTSGADGAAFTVVMAVTQPHHENKYERASMIIVPLPHEGVELVRNIPVMGDAGDDYLSHGELKFHHCRVPVLNRIGEEGQGFKLAQARLGPGRIHHCMRWIGICNRAFDLMCRRAASRMLDDKHSLSNMQVVQHWIAESNANIEAARLMVLQTAANMEVQGARAVKEQISAIKFFVANVLMEVLDKAIQVHGALGITDDTILSFWYRHERAARIYDGPDEVHKNALAKSILANYQQP